VTVGPAVLRVITRLNIGGPSTQAIYLTEELARRGYDPHLAWGLEAAREGRVDLPADLPATHLPDLRRELAPAVDRRAARVIRRLIVERRPQIVHTHMAKAGALGRWAAQREHVPIVVHTYHGHVLQEYFSRWKERAFLEAERRLARRTDALLAVSEEVRSDLLAMGIGTPDRWRVVPVGVDLSAFETLPDRAAARAGLGLPADAPVVGCVGRLVAVKDHATLLDAFTRLVERQPDAVLLIAGDGDLDGSLRQRARHLGDRVRFLGWVNDLPTLYAAIDVLALTSRMEGTPVAAIEAAAAGVPAVATRVGGVPSVVLDDHTGLLVPAGDAPAVADALASLFGDPGQRRGMGQAAAAHVRGRFSRERLADDLDALYRELLARKGLPGPATAPG